MQRNPAQPPVETECLQGRLLHHPGISPGFCTALNHISLKGQRGKERGDRETLWLCEDMPRHTDYWQEGSQSLSGLLLEALRSIKHQPFILKGRLNTQRLTVKPFMWLRHLTRVLLWEVT